MLTDKIHESQNHTFTNSILSFVKSHISDSCTSYLVIGLQLHQYLSLLRSGHGLLEACEIHFLPSCLLSMEEEFGRRKGEPFFFLWWVMHPAEAVLIGSNSSVASTRDLTLPGPAVWTVHAPRFLREVEMIIERAASVGTSFVLGTKEHGLREHHFSLCSSSPRGRWGFLQLPTSGSCHLPPFCNSNLLPGRFIYSFVEVHYMDLNCIV